MVKRWLWLPVAGLATALLVAACLLLLRPLTEPGTTVQKPPAYMVRTQNGQVVVCRGEEPTPVAWYEVYTALLPPEDVSALEKGIAVQSWEEAQRLLEDLGA